MKIDIFTIELMENEGGSFVKAIAKAWKYADPINKRKLEETFDYFQEYQKKSKRYRT